jgi:hypothetical protein
MNTRGGLWFAALVALAGCVVNQGSVGYTCDNPDVGYVDADGRPDPCHLREPADAGTDVACPDGELVRLPLGWVGPTRLWFGPEDQAPDCPLGPLSISYEGHTDLVASNDCDACSCAPPTGSCALPSKLTASTTTCGDFDAGSKTSFDAPTAWDGGCDNTSQTPTGAANSLTISALTVTDNGCAPNPTTPAKVVDSYWNTYARTCEGNEWKPGPFSQSVCTSGTEPSPSSFQLCIFHDNEKSCPPPEGDMFTEQHVFYGGVKDDRQCSACGCGSAVGSLCLATISIYKDANPTCSGQAHEKIQVGSEGPICLDIAPPGQALGSKSSGPTTYVPGVCQATGGQHSGNAVAIEPSTFCCRP